MDSAGPTAATTSPVSQSGRGIVLVAAAGLALAVIVGYTTFPLPPCPFKLLFHLPCPGCGITRSVAALLHGDVLTSLRYHPLGLPMCIVATTVVIRTVGRPRPLPEAMTRRLILVGLSALLIVWLIRLAFIASGSGLFLW